MSIYFTADTHYGHANVIKHSSRPFSNVDDMDESLVANWNAVVGPGDLVYHLGDFAFCGEDRAIEIAKQLNGNKYLVLGNHDKRLRRGAKFLSQWIWAKDLAEIEVEGQKIVLCHFALLTWNQSHRGSWNLHGHSHGSLADDPNALRIDVGVDCFDQTPVSFETIRDLMSLKTFKPIDHHAPRTDP